ncbi:MAG TPA: SUMF1/EgtB/PvdO family nonheme iron enzyme [Verrucomicrobiota bacterium]|nr:SUMF1/EgtB/PvdO family nonheme iron enzyme [Verrucomicrobiota bacterium]
MDSNGCICVSVPMFYRVRGTTLQNLPNILGVPAGLFQMGDTLGEGYSNEFPVHTVSLSGFLMDKYEVTKALWDAVCQWAAAHGYTFDNVGSGKATNHPVHTINWYDAVKWCNARSEMDGLTPAYYVDCTLATIYRTGRIDLRISSVNWSVNGYRLPTEAEWEYAARGGQPGSRFPWGDLVAHAQANYYSTNMCQYDNPCSYDTSPTRGYHPTYASGAPPYTSPVGSFVPNGYGLFDMSGNVAEWCWDEYGYGYSACPVSNPRGSEGGYYRMGRGGDWGSDANLLRCAKRDVGTPSGASNRCGFRCVRRL